MIDYNDFPGLAGVFLEDSYVLAISASSEQVDFHLDAVLTPEHPAYHSPRPGEHYCYAKGSLVFPDVTRVVWLKRSSSHYTDGSGEEDLGNIDILRVDGDAFVAEGDWGAVRITGAQPRFELRRDAQHNQGVDERLRVELLTSGLSDWVSLAEVQQIISHFQLANTDKERQDLVLRTIRSLLQDGFMQIGELPGPDGKFPAWEPIDAAMDRLRERFVGHYDEPASWDHSIWLGLTDTGRPAAEALRGG